MEILTARHTSCERDKSLAVGELVTIPPASQPGYYVVIGFIASSNSSLPLLARCQLVVSPTGELVTDQVAVSVDASRIRRCTVAQIEREFGDEVLAAAKKKANLMRFVVLPS